MAALQKGDGIVPEAMFDGDDTEQYRDEVQQRWGEDAWEDSERWWEGLGPGGQADFRAESAALVRDWQRAAEEGLPVTSPRVLDLARRQADWVGRAWGGRRPSAAELRGLGEMYVADPRFTDTYGGEAVAWFVRDALAAHAAAVTP